MFKATEVEKKKRNKSTTYQYAKKFLCAVEIKTYPPEIIQTNSLSSSRKNHWNTMTACI